MLACLPVMVHTLLMTHTMIKSWSDAVDTERAGSWSKLTAAREWVGQAVLAEDTERLSFALATLMGWLDLEVRGLALRTAVEGEVRAIHAYMVG